MQDTQTQDCAQIRAIVNYWFGELDDNGLSDPAKNAMWFKKSQDTDREIQNLFGSILQQASTGECDHWTESDNGLIALILLLDQFSRNIHRDSAAAFAQDAKALAIAQHAVASKRHLQLPAIHRVFLYLPLEHCEDLAIQEQCVRLFTELVAEHGQALATYLQYAVAHRDVIASFGRFPHRNKVLGRKSSKEELLHLKLNGGF